MSFFDHLLHLFQQHLIPITLSVALSGAAGATIGLLLFFYAEPYSLVVDVRKRVAWITAVCGCVICCCIVFVFDIHVNPLTFAGFLLSGAVISSGAGLLPLTFALPMLRRSIGISAENRVRSHMGKERLKDF